MNSSQLHQHEATYKCSITSTPGSKAHPHTAPATSTGPAQQASKHRTVALALWRQRRPHGLGGQKFPACLLNPTVSAAEATSLSQDLSAVAFGQPLTLCQRPGDHRASETPCPEGEGTVTHVPALSHPSSLPCVFHTSSKRVKLSPLMKLTTEEKQHPSLSEAVLETSAHWPGRMIS